MILTVNIGNTHITIARLRTRHPAVQRAAAFQPGRNGGRIRHEPAESALLISGCPRADRGRHSGQCGARTDRPGIGCAADVLLCPLPDRWPRPEKRHQAAAGQPAQLGAELLCGAVAALEEGPGPLAVISADTAISIMAVNGKQELVGGVILPGPQLSLSALVQKLPSCPRSTSPLQLPPRSWARTPLPAYRTVLCWAPPGCWMGWPSVFRQSLAQISAFMPPATCPAPSGRPAARPFSTGSI